MRDINWEKEYEMLEIEIEQMMRKTLLRYEAYESQIEAEKKKLAEATKKIGKMARDQKQTENEKKEVEQELEAQLQKYKGLFARCEKMEIESSEMKKKLVELQQENDEMLTELERFQSSMIYRLFRRGE